MRIALIFSVTLVLPGLSAHGQERNVRFDGYYQSATPEILTETNDTCWTYLRFFSDHSITQGFSAGVVPDIQYWLKRGGADAGEEYGQHYTFWGRYTIKKDSIFFTAKSTEAAFVVRGRILRNGSLRLEMRNKRGNQATSNVYLFRKAKMKP
ncbi:hypothetical protein [Flaviaesturariibacter amylovorans]|uniref:Lipocalin-like domain-containing protein n=1 Tax=Flaviaesturariibacter amylovorans TaxID=1084520 RepID=A0ABP8G7Y4_9BACT